MSDDHRPPEGEFEGRTFLYIRTSPGDNGSVPRSQPVWMSPDISIVKPDGTTGGEAVPLDTNIVKVKVTNAGGMPAVDAYVDAFVANPTTVVTPSTSTFIGYDTADVPAYGSATVNLPWVPQESDVGHRCLLARVSLIFPPDTYADPLTFDVLGDRHIAQRNIHVLEVPHGGALSFRFEIGGAEEDPRREFRVRAVERTAELTLQDLADNFACPVGLPAEMPLAGLSVRMLEARETAVRPSLTRPGKLRLGVTSGADDRKSDQSADVLVDQDSEAFGSVTFDVSGDDEPGRLHVVDLVQQHRRSRETVGGLTFLLRVV